MRSLLQPSAEEALEALQTRVGEPREGQIDRLLQQPLRMVLTRIPLPGRTLDVLLHRDGPLSRSGPSRLGSERY